MNPVRNPASNLVRKACRACGGDFPALPLYFDVRLDRKPGREPKARLSTECRRCRRQRNRERQETPAFKKWWKSYRDAGKQAAACRRYRASPKGKLKRHPVGKTQAQQYNRLRHGIDAGYVVIPEACELCGLPKKLCADWSKGYTDPYRIAFVCYPCHAILRAMRRRRSNDEGTVRKLSIVAALAEERAYASNVRRANIRYGGRKKKHLRERRRIYLVYCCGRSRSETKTIMEEEGWFKKKALPPLELVLGMWLPYCRPRALSATA